MVFAYRIAAIALAAVMAASPVLSCCKYALTLAVDGSGLAATPLPSADATAIPTAAMAKDCDDAMASGSPPAPFHDPNCAGCVDCFNATSAKAPTLAPVGAVSVNAPAQIMLGGPHAPVAAVRDFARRNFTPPAVGPPRTPVSLKNIMRI